MTLRNINNPILADIYIEQAHQMVVARDKLNCFYIVFGDVSGKMRI